MQCNSWLCTKSHFNKYWLNKQRLQIKTYFWAISAFFSSFCLTASSNLSFLSLSYKPIRKKNNNTIKDLVSFILKQIENYNFKSCNLVSFDSFYFQKLLKNTLQDSPRLSIQFCIIIVCGKKGSQYTHLFCSCFFQLLFLHYSLIPSNDSTQPCVQI